jgi:hypothetical protein
MSSAFLPAPALPLRARRLVAMQTKPAPAVMCVAASPRTTTRRAFAAGALGALAVLVLPRAQGADAATATVGAPAATAAKTATKVADPVRVATSLIEAAIKADPTIAATMLRLAVS